MSKAKKQRSPGDDVGWPDIPFNRGGHPPELVHIVQPRELRASEVCQVPGFNAIYDFATDRIYSFEYGDDGGEMGVCEVAADTLDQYDSEEL